MQSHNVKTHSGDLTLAQLAIVSVTCSELAKHASRKSDNSELAAAHSMLIGLVEERWLMHS